ncbi:MAG: Na+/H+ antiporter subunit G [Chloroflexi bacterium]|nr:Na+/H+ antiporter subunit G [Chloroflexota bacterium]
MTEVVTGMLILVGAILMFLAGLGITRMPDLFLRMSATTKVATLGLGAVMLAVVIYFDDLVATSHAVATILFVFLSAPVAAHIIGRAAYFSKVPLWEGTVTDQLRGHYDIKTHQLESIEFPDLEQHLPDVEMRRFSLSATSPVAGQTLAQIDLRRRYDVTVLAIRRKAEVLSNPDGDEHLCPDDELIIMGLPEKLDKVGAVFR